MKPEHPFCVEQAPVDVVLVFFATLVVRFASRMRFMA